MLRWATVRATALLPFGPLRTLLYRLIPSYEIHPSARIGWLAVIDVDSLEMRSGSRIGFGSHISGPMRVSLGVGSSLGGKTRVECGHWHEEVDAVDAPCAREFTIGDQVLVTSGHYFDAIGGLYVGSRTCIAGRGSQFWTHGLSVADRSVFIGDHCYIGSAVRFAPGARIGSDVVVGIGSVVVSDLGSVDRALVAGVPARVIRTDYVHPGWV